MTIKHVSALLFTGLIATSGSVFAAESSAPANKAGLGTEMGQKTGEGAGAATGAGKPTLNAQGQKKVQ